LLLLLWVVIFRGLEKHSGLLWLLSGIVLGLAVQARPNALPLILFFPLLTFFRWGRRRTVRPEVEDLGYTSEVGNPGYTSEVGDLGCTSEVGDLGYTSEVGDPGCTSAVKGHGHTFSPLLAIGGLLAIQILFGFVNARYSGEFSPMTQAGGINFYLGNSEKADGMIPRQDRYAVYEGEYRDPIQVMAEQGFREATGTTGALSPKAVSDHWKQKTLGQIQQDPMRWIGLIAKKSWLMLWNHEVPNNRSFETQDTPLLRWLPVRWWLLLALFPWGVAALLKKGKGEQVLWIASFFILFSGTVVLFFVNSRFRIPLWPGMAVVAGGGAVYLWNSIRTGNIPKGPVVFSAILLPLSLINWFGIPPDPIENDLSMRATAYYDLGRYEDALADVEQCLEIAQNNPGYYFSHGNILMALGNNEAAIQSYLQAIGLNASDPMFHNNLGIAFENSGNFKNAEMAYRKALELRPTHRAARTNLMLLSIHEKRLEQAGGMLASLLAEEPQNSTLLCAKALIDFKETGNPKALDYARQMNPALVQQILDLE
jgi:cytochrome c-type biogenesis protein CcmH/NrfG